MNLLALAHLQNSKFISQLWEYKRKNAKSLLMSKVY